jgi:hypothetical protein
MSSVLLMVTMEERAHIMPGLDPLQFRELIVRPTLQALALHSEAAENLVWGTAVHESRLMWLRQAGGGPALGLYQIEPATYADLCSHYLSYRPAFAAAAERFLAPAPSPVEQLVANLSYATAICRFLYHRAPPPLPDADDIDGLAAYWKAHYNTPLGKGRAAEWAQHYRETLQ